MQVQDDCPVRRGESAAAAVEQLGELTLRTAVRGPPGGLRLRGGEDALGASREDVAQRCRRRGRQGLRTRGKRVTQLGGDVDVVVELVHQVGRDRLLDHWIGEHFPTGIGPRIRVEHDAVDPDRQRADRQEDRAERDQAAHAPEPLAAGLRRRRLGGGSLGCRFCVHRLSVLSLRVAGVTRKGRADPSRAGTGVPRRPAGSRPRRRPARAGRRSRRRASRHARLVKPSRVAIAEFDPPSAIRLSTSSSRAVRRASSADSSGAAASRSMTIGSTTEPPEATARMASRISSPRSMRSVRRYARPATPSATSCSRCAGLTASPSTTNPILGLSCRARTAMRTPSSV